MYKYLSDYRIQIDWSVLICLIYSCSITVTCWYLMTNGLTNNFNETGNSSNTQWFGTLMVITNNDRSTKLSTLNEYIIWRSNLKRICCPSKEYYLQSTLYDASTQWVNPLCSCINTSRRKQTRHPSLMFFAQKTNWREPFIDRTRALFIIFIYVLYLHRYYMTEE